MFKRCVAIFSAVFLIIAILPIFYIQRVLAYENASYLKDLKIGLVSMSAPLIKLTLNGDYNLNGQVYLSGTVINLEIKDASILLNGVPKSQISLSPNDKANTISIASNSLSNKYMGSFIIKVSNGKLLPINILDIENYLKGVVGYEMSDSYPIEALKSQAVTARNYALSRIGYEASKGYDLDDTISFQIYKGYNSNFKRVISAVDQTRGEILLYNNKLVEAIYSAWHGGASEDSENVWGNYVPYLRSVQDTFESNPWPAGNIILSRSEIQTALLSKKYLSFGDTFLRLDLNSISRFKSGRVSNINIVYINFLGLEQTKSISRDYARSFLSLPSNLYTVYYDLLKDTYTFTGKGYGHGLGMSQIGAKNRAIAGQTYAQILMFYYQGTYLQNIIPKASLNSLTLSKSALLTESNISFKTSAYGGTRSGYLYKYVVKNGSTVVLAKDYSSTDTLDFIPKTLGNYTVEAYVKDIYSVSEYDDKKVSSFKVYEIPIISSFNISKPAILVGEPISADIAAQKGSGSYLYKYEVVSSGHTVTVKDFSSDNQFKYIPSNAGSYTITAYIKDSLWQNNGALNGVSFRKLNFEVKSKPVYTPKLTNVTASGYFYPGKPSSFTASSTGASPSGIYYKYEIYYGGKLQSSSAYSKSSTFTYTPVSSGSYTIKVYGKDALSTRSYDSIKQFNITINSNPLYFSRVPLKLGSKSKDVTNLQSALTKLGYRTTGDSSVYFGAKTKSALIAFQKSRKIKADGIVESGTYIVLNNALIEKSGTKKLTY